MPIEAVAAVIECKSNSMNSEHLKNWAESIEVLTTSCESCARMHGYIAIGKKENNSKESPKKSTQTATRPLRILCCLNDVQINEILQSKNNLFDCIIRAPMKSQGLAIEFDSTK